MKADTVDRFMSENYRAELETQYQGFRSYVSRLGARYIVEYRGGVWTVYGYLSAVPKEAGK